MTDRLTPAEITDAAIAPWSSLADQLDATFTLPSYAAGGAFAARIAALADEQNHHPAIDLRWPGLVHVVTSSHDAGGVTARDIRLARAITALAHEDGATVPQ